MADHEMKPHEWAACRPSGDLATARLEPVPVQATLEKPGNKWGIWFANLCIFNTEECPMFGLTKVEKNTDKTPSYVWCCKLDHSQLTNNRRWQPLTESNGLGYLYTQEHVTPHIGITARFFGFNSADDEEAFASRELAEPEYISR